MAKFHYSTPLNPFAKTGNRVSLIGNDLMVTVVDGKRQFYNISVNDLPFTPGVMKAYRAVSDHTEMEYFNIGTRPEASFSVQDTDILHINYIMFLTAMRRAHARHTWLKSVPQYFTSYVREDIMSSTYIHRLKMVTLQALIAGWSPRKYAKQIRKLYVDNGFPAETYMLYMLFWVSGEAQRTIEGLLEVKEPFLLDYEAMFEETNIIIAESNLESLATNEARLRLTFIANSNRYKTEDFAQELISRSRQAYLHCRPFLGRQHSINYARSCIPTFALRIMNHYNDPVRARLVTTKDGDHTNRSEAIDEGYSDGSTEDAVIDLLDMKREMLGDAFYAR